MEEKTLDVQDYPSVDSPPTDPFEALVAAYYQRQGYITSSAKWFWVRDSTKTQRGYQDIDLLAVNGHETVIVSVSGNLDDKVSLSRDGILNMNSQIDHFKRVELYLNRVEAYRWMVDGRSIRRVIAYASATPLAAKLKQSSQWQQLQQEWQLELLYAGKIVTELREMIMNQTQSFKSNNQIVKLLQIVAWLDKESGQKLLDTAKTVASSEAGVVTDSTPDEI